jgi:hypothetical protein
MLTLSLRQPYAELILRGIKTVEYRTRPTRQQGQQPSYSYHGVKGWYTVTERPPGCCVAPGRALLEWENWCFVDESHSPRRYYPYGEHPADAKDPLFHGVDSEVESHVRDLGTVVRTGRTFSTGETPVPPAGSSIK